MLPIIKSNKYADKEAPEDYLEHKWHAVIYNFTASMHVTNHLDFVYNDCIVIRLN